MTDKISDKDKPKIEKTIDHAIADCLEKFMDVVDEIIPKASDRKKRDLYFLFTIKLCYEAVNSISNDDNIEYSFPANAFDFTSMLTNYFSEIIDNNFHKNHTCEDCDGSQKKSPEEVVEELQNVIKKIFGDRNND